MFSTLSQSLTGILGKIKGRGYLSPKDIDSAMRDVRVALLEADVSLEVVKDFIGRIRSKALGAEVIKSITPGQMVVKIVHDELVYALSGESSEEQVVQEDQFVEGAFGSKEMSCYIDPGLERAVLQGSATGKERDEHVGNIVLLLGLQGSGKTTTAAKLASLLHKKHRKRVLLASVDIYRPAAQLQLEILSKQIGIDCLPIVQDESPFDISKRALLSFRKNGYDSLIIDTAGRLQDDTALTEELQGIVDIVKPTEKLLVVDAMLGQEAANIAKVFDSLISLTGIILTRADGDARGGAILSMRSVTQRPIKFVGTGERIGAFEQFHPKRAASMILGMGDVVSLVEKAAEVISEQEADELAIKLQKGTFDMNDLLHQMQSITKIGSFSSILSMIPGMKGLQSKIDPGLSQNTLQEYQALIHSMTPKERANPDIIRQTPSRKRRIALGSGKKVEHVNRLLNQYKQMQLMMKGFSGGRNFSGMIEGLMNKF